MNTPLENLNRLKSVIEEMIEDNIPIEDMKTLFNEDGTPSCIKARYVTSLLGVDNLEVEKDGSYYIPSNHLDITKLVELGVDSYEHFNAVTIAMYNNVFSEEKIISLELRLRNVNRLIAIEEDNL